MRYEIRYHGVLQEIHRVFPTYERAIQWLRQIGRKDLIRQIRAVEPTPFLTD